jgi:hypothetical protein
LPVTTAPVTVRVPELRMPGPDDPETIPLEMVNPPIATLAGAKISNTREARLPLTVRTLGPGPAMSSLG